MTCKELSGFLMDYLEGLLPQTQRLRFEEHLGECPDCAAYLATYKQTIGIARSAYGDDEKVPDDVPEDLVRAIIAARRA